MVFAVEEGGAAAIGIISLVQLIPAAVIAPFGSVLGDRFPRGKVFMLAGASMGSARSRLRRSSRWREHDGRSRSPE
jgi:hypothetical protein